MNNRVKVIIIFNLPVYHDYRVGSDIYNILANNNIQAKAIKVVAKEDKPTCSTVFVYFHEQNDHEVESVQQLFSNRTYNNREIRVDIQNKQQYASQHTEGKKDHCDCIYQWIYSAGHTEFNTIHLVKEAIGPVQQINDVVPVQQMNETIHDVVPVQQTLALKHRQRSLSAPPVAKPVFNWNDFRTQETLDLLFDIVV